MNDCYAGPALLTIPVKARWEEGFKYGSQNHCGSKGGGGDIFGGDDDDMFGGGGRGTITTRHRN